MNARSFNNLPLHRPNTLQTILTGQLEAVCTYKKHIFKYYKILVKDDKKFIHRLEEILFHVTLFIPYVHESQASYVGTVSMNKEAINLLSCKL